MKVPIFFFPLNFPLKLLGKTHSTQSLFPFSSVFRIREPFYIGKLSLLFNMLILTEIVFDNPTIKDSTKWQICIFFLSCFCVSVGELVGLEMNSRKIKKERIRKERKSNSSSFFFVSFYLFNWLM